MNQLSAALESSNIVYSGLRLKGEPSNALITHVSPIILHRTTEADFPPELKPKTIRRNRRAGFSTTSWNGGYKYPFVEMQPGNCLEVKIPNDSSWIYEDICQKYDQMENCFKDSVRQYRSVGLIEKDFTISCLMIEPSPEHPYFSFMAYRIDGTSLIRYPVRPLRR